MVTVAQASDQSKERIYIRPFAELVMAAPKPCFMRQDLPDRHLQQDYRHDGLLRMNAFSDTPRPAPKKLKE